MEDWMWICRGCKLILSFRPGTGDECPACGAGNFVGFLDKQEADQFRKEK